MKRRFRPTHALAGLLLAVGCGEPGDDSGGIESYQQALNACDEMVPANRHVDGIPAYAQCAMYQSGPIYSNNGVDTSATKVGADWVRTQPSGGYQCTELAHRYWVFRWNVTWLPRGNAGSWCDTMPPANSGVVQTTTPMHGDLMVLAPGSCGADATTGHVTVVDVVDTATQRLTVVEQNRARRGTYMQSCAKCFLHVVANQNGVPPDAGAMPVDAGAPDAGSSRPSPMSGVDAGAGAPPLNPRDASLVPDTGAGPDANTSVVDAGGGPIPHVDAGVSPDAGGISPMLPIDPGGLDDADEEGGCSLSGHTASRSLAHQWLLLALGALFVSRRRRR